MYLVSGGGGAGGGGTCARGQEGRMQGKGRQARIGGVVAQLSWCHVQGGKRGGFESRIT